MLDALARPDGSGKRPRDDDDDVQTFKGAIRQAYSAAAGDLCAVIAAQTNNPPLAAAAAGREPSAPDAHAALACLAAPAHAPDLVAAFGRRLADAPSVVTVASRRVARPLARLGPAGPRGLRAAWLALHRIGVPAPVTGRVWDSWLGPENLAPAAATVFMPLNDLTVGVAFAVADEFGAHCGPTIDAAVGRWALWCAGYGAALPPVPRQFGLACSHPYAAPTSAFGSDAVQTMPVSSGLFTMSSSRSGNTPNDRTD